MIRKTQKNQKKLKVKALNLNPLILIYGRNWAKKVEIKIVTFATPVMMMMMTGIVSTLTTATARMDPNHTAVAAVTRKVPRMAQNRTAVEAATRIAPNQSTVTVVTPILKTGMDLPATQKLY